MKTTPDKKRPRILLSLCEIAGFYTNLEKGFNQLGVIAKTGFVTTHTFLYTRQESNGILQKIILRIRILGLFGRALNKLILIPLYFIYCLLKYNTFIFGYKQTFFCFFKDLPILKFFGKKIIFYFHGSDSRPPYLDGFHSRVSTAQLYEMTKRQKKDIRQIEKYADYILDHPPGALFHQRKSFMLIKWEFLTKMISAQS